MWFCMYICANILGGVVHGENCEGVWKYRVKVAIVFYAR